MSSEQLADGVNPLDAELAATWDVLKGYSGRDTDLGIARRFGGAAAAYSLRDIGAMNGRVVKARRDVGETSDPEEDFSANQVQSGALEDWVNGKLETTLPADVSTAAAAYSLRKVKASYSGDAVRIRRSSDDVEVDVAFDSDGKVSASSAITNVSEQGGEIGSTTTTDLNGFLNETLTVGTAVNGTSPYNNYTLSGESSTGFSAINSSGVGSAGFPYLAQTGDVIVVRYTVSNFSSISSLSPQIRGVDSLNSVASTASGGTVFTANGTYTDTLTATGEVTHLMFADGNQGSYTISDFQIVSHTHQVFVHTWYDQAGSNDAVQETAANQPKIAENGALLADGIDFDGVNDELRTSTNIASSQPVTVMSVTKPDAANKRIFESITNSVRAFYGGSSQTGMNAGNTLLGSTNEISTNTEYLQTHLFNTTNSKVFLNNVETISGDAGSNAFAGNFSLGGSSAVFNGTIKEIILYTSDQSDNRFKIESNINNYYGLYNDANEMATDWSDDPTAPYGSAFTSNGKDGYTIDYSAGVASTRARWQFANNVPSGEVVYYSFNASITSGTPAVILKQSNGTSNANSSSVAITNGFNSGSITTNAEAVYFAIGDTEGTQSFTISDFKISRIARNGFVETLYDQSGNGDDMTQATAGSQPAIVQNGGQVKLICGKPAFKGDGTNDFLEASYFYSAGEVTSLSGFTVFSNDSDTGQEEAIISAGYGLSTTYPGFSIQLDRNSNADPFEIRTANASGSNETPLLSIAKDGDILGSTFFTKDDTQLVRATTKDGSSNNSEATSVGALHSNSTSGKLRIGAIRSFAVRQFFGFFISEAIVFKGSDLRDEGIENEINQFYNIG